MININSKTSIEECLKIAAKDGYLIRYMEWQKTIEVCLAAVKQEGLSIQFVPDEKRTPEICSAAVTDYENTIEFLNDEQKSLDVCLIAVSKNISLLSYVNNIDHIIMICRKLEIYDKVTTYANPQICEQFNQLSYAEIYGYMPKNANNF
jgi:hypothetical protein